MKLSLWPKLMVVWVSSPIECLCSFLYFFFNLSSCVWPNSGFWCCVFLTLHITLLVWETLFDSSCANHYGWTITSTQFHFYFFNIDAGHVHGPKLSFRALTLHFAIVVNAVRTRVLLQSFPLSHAFVLFFFTLSFCAPITSSHVSVRRSK
jgi:hypothetical protein